MIVFVVLAGFLLGLAILSALSTPLPRKGGCFPPCSMIDLPNPEETPHDRP